MLQKLDLFSPKLNIKPKTNGKRKLLYNRTVKNGHYPLSVSVLRPSYLMERSPTL